MEFTWSYNNVTTLPPAHAGKTISQVMAENTADTFQGYITSHEHAERLEAEYTQLASAQIAVTIRQESLADIPRTNEGRAHWRERIFYAITDFSNVVNKDRVITLAPYGAVSRGTRGRTRLADTENEAGKKLLFQRGWWAHTPPSTTRRGG
ncbi:hypothetical protein B0H65DRAFT_551550 [Neurospora tetraspora]|uniref:Uncharacterized protein n=1 Tax=Neurospora tetraspora TaxID=94610 RepID=A0AAE0J827_9PEZI|nr:hypothetical protein B0H65DRAFT_551550 [Neurospora tetraspora]